MMRFNADFRVPAFIQFDATKYVPSPSFGVNRFFLDRIGAEKARATTIVEYKANSRFPNHTHIGGEEFLVLAGTFRDEFGAFKAGTYVRNPVDSQHAPWVEDDGCTIYVKLLQMAEMPKETKPLHIDTTDPKDRVATEYGFCQKLYQNEKTGEYVEMCFLKPNVYFPADEKSRNGGEEIFIVDGMLLVHDTPPGQNNNDNDVSSSSSSSLSSFSKWGWLRFPQILNVDKVRVIQAGPDGAQVFRKTGHLTEKALAMEKIQIKEDD